MAEKMRQKIGIMGGTFDPIHIGHLILAEHAYSQFQLDKVLVMPSGNPPHKPVRIGRADTRQRIAMTRLAIADNEHFELSLEEADDTDYTYTYRTLERLSEANPEVDYYFIMGADSLVNFESWYKPQRISQLCTILVAVRDQMDGRDLDQRIARIRERYSAKIEKLNTLNIDISSELLRRWVQEGRSLRYYVPETVVSYIRQENLYKGTDFVG